MDPRTEKVVAPLVAIQEKIKKDHQFDLPSSLIETVTTKINKFSSAQYKDSVREEAINAIVNPCMTALQLIDATLVLKGTSELDKQRIEFLKMQAKQICLTHQKNPNELARNLMINLMHMKDYVEKQKQRGVIIKKAKNVVKSKENITLVSQIQTLIQKYKEVSQKIKPATNEELETINLGVSSRQRSSALITQPQPPKKSLFSFRR